MYTNTISNRKKIIISILIIFLIGIIILGISLLSEKKVYNVYNEREYDYHEVIYNNEKYIYNTSIISILFMGIDTKDNEKQGQADSIQILLLNRKTQSIQVISLSRDIMTEIKLFDAAYNELGWHKQHLGLAYSYGDSKASGGMLMTQSISKMLGGIPIVNYVAMDLNILPNVHSIVGDLEVVMPNDSLEAVNEKWKEGETIIITNENIEEYIRTRDINEEFSNNYRMERQKAYGIEYFKKIKEMLEDNFDETIKEIYNACNDMTTNISFNDLKSFGEMILTYSFDYNNEYYILKGEDISGEIHDEFEVDQDYLNKLIIKLFYSREE